MNYYVIVFKNTHDAMAGEKELKKLGYNFKIMPTPTSITQSCGICIRLEDDKYIKDIINNKYIEFKNIYHKSDEGFVEI